MRTVLLYISMLAVGVALLVPAHAQAQVSQLCWTEKECEAYRAKYVNTSEVKDGFYAADKHDDALKECGATINAAKQPLGFCLPAGKSVTKISFGGRTEFANIGDFIQFIYKYGFMVATVIAVLMVMTGGVMWIFSGGNTDTITKARSKLTGAVMGLVLLGLSYSILNLVNPYLVNLRLPEIWAINSIGLAPPTCNLIDTEDPKPLAVAFKQGQKIEEKEKNKLLLEADYAIEKDKAACGDNFFVKGTKGQTCQGIFCKEGGGQVCAQKQGDTIKCHDGFIAGNITNSDILGSLDSNAIQLVTEDWEWEWVDNNAGDEIELYYVCNDKLTIGDTDFGADTSVLNDAKKIQWYTIKGQLSNAINKGTNACQSKGGLMGFVLNVEFNESYDFFSETNLLGKNGNNIIDFGNSSMFKATLSKGSIPDDHFIKPKHLENGLFLNIDAGQATDTD